MGLSDLGSVSLKRGCLVPAQEILDVAEIALWAIPLSSADKRIHGRGSFAAAIRSAEGKDLESKMPSKLPVSF